jgi:hypothetical protein
MFKNQTSESARCSTILACLLFLTLSLMGQAKELAPFDLKIKQLTTGDKHHFFGYIGQCRTIPWNSSGRYILGMEIDRIDRMPKPEEAAIVILIDTQDHNKILRIEKHTRGIRNKEPCFIGIHWLQKHSSSSTIVM